MRAQDYAGVFRNTRVEQDLAKSLRELPEEESYRFICDLVEVHEIVALELANRVLRDRKYFSRLLDYAIKNANASSIRHWIKAVLPRLGMLSVIDKLQSNLNTFPEGVARAYYYLPQWVDRNDQKCMKALDALHRHIKDVGHLREPRMIENPDGSVCFDPLDVEENQNGNGVDT